MRRLGKIIVACIMGFIVMNAAKLTCEATTTVSVNTFADLQKYLKSEAAYDIKLTGNIEVSSKLYVIGSKKIIGNGKQLIRKTSYISDYIIQVNDNAILSLTGDLKISGNSEKMKNSDYGLIRVLPAGTLKMYANTVLLNSYTIKGVAGIRNYGKVYMYGGSITNCYSKTYGGAMMIEEGAATAVNGGKIYANTSEKQGGAIYIKKNASLSAKGGTIYSNKATNGGNAIATDGRITLGGTISVNTNNDIFLLADGDIAIGDWTSPSMIALCSSNRVGKRLVTEGIAYKKYFKWSNSFTASATNPICSYGKHLVIGRYFQITYDANGGTKAPAALKKVYGTPLTLSSTVPVRTGYTFLGWYTKVDGGSLMTGATYTLEADLKLYARWRANTYTITFEMNGALEQCKTMQVTYAGTYSNLPIPTKTGYTFSGWYSDATCSKEIKNITKVTVTANQKLYAGWKPNSYTVYFDYRGGNQKESSLSCTYYQKYGVLPVTEKEGYTFLGWYLDSNDRNTKITEESIVGTACDHMLYAYWVSEVFEVKLDPNGGKVNSSVLECVYDEKYGVLPNPTREGYEFLGWYTQKDGGYLVNSEMVYRDTTIPSLYAHWKVATYQVTFDTRDGKKATTKKVTWNQLYGTLPIPTRSGYDFQGWYFDKAYKQPCSSKTKVTTTKNHILYAKWKKITVVKLSVTGIPKIYFTGQKLDLRKIVLSVTYSNGKTAKVKTGYRVLPYSVKEGGRSVTIAYKEKSVKVKAIWYNKSLIAKAKPKKSAITLYVGGRSTITLNCKYNLTPYIRYTSSNSAVVKVTGKGQLTASKKGTAYITVVTSMNGLVVKNKVKVTVKVKPKPSKQLNVTIVPSKSNWRMVAFQGKINGKKVTSTYTSSNTKVGKIGKRSGTFTANKSGTTYITVKVGSQTKKFKITIDIKRKKVTIKR